MGFFVDNHIVGLRPVRVYTTTEVGASPFHKLQTKDIRYTGPPTQQVRPLDLCM